jgi:hypothetical protein
MSPWTAKDASTQVVKELRESELEVDGAKKV